MIIKQIALSQHPGLVLGLGNHDRLLIFLFAACARTTLITGQSTARRHCEKPLKVSGTLSNAVTDEVTKCQLKETFPRKSLSHASMWNV